MRLILAALVLSFSTGAFASQPGGAQDKGWGPPGPAQWFKNNLHLIEEDASNGFAIYRTSKPAAKDMRNFCKLGITEMMVLSGTAGANEFRYQDQCPTLKVIYNQAQTTKEPVDRAFLKDFDIWVGTARALGKKIAFRCECGCHRTGRLAAYYQMKYQGLSLDDTLALLTKNGQWMLFYPHIYKQVRALNDFIKGVPCSQKKKYCVRE